MTVERHGAQPQAKHSSVLPREIYDRTQLVYTPNLVTAMSHHERYKWVITGSVKFCNI